MIGEARRVLHCMLVLHLAVVSSTASWPANWSCFTDSQISEIWKKTGAPWIREGPPIRLDRSVWLANKFGPTISAILWREIMQYDVIITDLDIDDEVYVMDRLANGSTDVNLEVWSGHDVVPDVSYEKYVLNSGKLLDLHDSGGLRQYGWFMPLYFQPNGIWIEFWRSWASNKTVSLLSQGGVIDPEMYISDPFIPPICLNHTCGELLAIAPMWDGGVSPQIITNLGLRLRIVYVGSNLNSIIITRLNNRLPFLFGNIEPSMFSSPPRETFRILLPEFSYDCYANYTSLPNGSVKCDFPKFSLKKFARTGIFPNEYFDSDGCSPVSNMVFDDDDDEDNHDLEHYIDLFNFMESYEFSTRDQQKLLAQARVFLDKNKLTDEIPIYELACGWIHQNNQTWIDWVEMAIRVLRLDQKTEIGIIVASISLMMVVVISQIIFLCFRNHPIFSNAVYPNIFWFYQIVLFGIYFSLFWVMLNTIVEVHQWYCSLSTPLYCISFTLIFVSLILKNYSAYCIFKGKSGKAMPSEQRLSSILLIFLIYDLLVNVIWFLIAPPKVSTANILREGQYYSVLYCEFRHESAFQLSSYIPKTLFAFWGAFIGFRCSGLTFNYNESKKIAFITYIMCIESLVWIILQYQENPRIRTENNKLLVLVGIITVLIFLFFPKFWYILTLGKGDRSNKKLQNLPDDISRPIHSAQWQPVNIKKPMSPLSHSELESDDMDYSLLDDVMSPFSENSAILQHRMRSESMRV